ncbi:MAG: LuxE/PaaK family acyltransferase [Putridiphycobacter sp.]
MVKNKFISPNRIFEMSSDEDFETLALEVFNYQYLHNKVYRTYCDYLKVDLNQINALEKIPFLPISFFKTHQVYCGSTEFEIEFTSSGTTGMQTSSHYVKDLSIYETAFIKGFEEIYGPIRDYIVLGLLPSYLEREGSSLIYMVQKMIDLSIHQESGFFLNDFDKLESIINSKKNDTKILLIGVSYALLDFAEQNHPDLSGCIVMETGGMKGRRKEMPKKDLHNVLKQGFNVSQIHSEYGMTELLSQAYAIDDGKFKTPRWMKILIREYNDPFTYTNTKSGGINIIDLANIYSCAFIATQDLGKIYPDYFEVLGRFDNSDIRGCNLLVQ